MQINGKMLPKRYLLGGGVFLLLILGLIIGAVHPYKHALGSQPPALPDVEVLQVQQEDVPVIHEWIGTLDGLVNADVRAQVTGYLLKQGYQEGAFVKQGQLLFQIDPRPFQAALDQAQGQLAQANALLANAKSILISPPDVAIDHLASGAK
jgi:multidrug efflux pump subunit AcrA (membrane-fusion protein)